jgi:FtsP/CotA-like multicopper oxidase with cupredoxin domain
MEASKNMKNMNRRELMRMGLMSGAALAAARGTKLWAGGGGGQVVAGGNQLPDSMSVPSPFTTPWAVEMPLMEAQPPIAVGPAGNLSLTGGLITPQNALSPTDAIQRSTHQFYNQFYPVKWYEMSEQEGPHSWHPDLPVQPVWGFEGKFPGPLFISRYGTPELLRVHNKLPATNASLGFGIPSTSTHLHNLHAASESDGFPTDFINTGEYHDHHYPMCRPGFTTAAGEDPRETLGSIWYHDHRQDFTAQNTYAGLVGARIMYDDLDTGDETTGLHLPSGPSGEYDVPILICDKAFDADTGLLYFNPFNFDGMLGDKLTANGVVQPFFRVQARRYRFRLLPAGPSRFWEFHLSDESPLCRIANDGNLLPFPVFQQGIRLGPAERADVIIDFSNYTPGTSVYLMNRLEQINGRGPTGNLLNPGDPIIRFDVIPAAGKDNSVMPTAATPLRPQPDINLAEVVTHRTFRLDRSQGGWAINGAPFDPNRISAHVTQNTAELWTLQNNSGDWSHPMHIHFEEFRIMDRNGAPPPAWERGRKDVVVVGPNESVTFFMRFRDFTGRYPMHCHNTVHEDHAMMIRWDLEA